mmetsp:Transcript_76772/g.94235  ORF Transcript_76772/g.94235 Transcript_76772/m.94235 type:complete len:234 (-) Transcript_76772:62-763(-)
MSLYLSNTSDFTLTKTETENLLQSYGILSVIESKWPTVAKAINHNALGMTKILIATGAMKGAQRRVKFKIDRAYTESAHSAWTKYRDAVKQYLYKEVNDSAHLEKARVKIAGRICDFWYKKAPRWADPGKEGGTFNLELHEQDYVDPPYHNYVYIYHVSGSIWMKDHTTGTWSNPTFWAELWGNPDVKLSCIKLDKNKLNDCNKYSLKALKDSADEYEDVPFLTMMAKLGIKN